MRPGLAWSYWIRIEYADLVWWLRAVSKVVVSPQRAPHPIYSYYLYNYKIKQSDEVYSSSYCQQEITTLTNWEIDFSLHELQKRSFYLCLLRLFNIICLIASGQSPFLWLSLFLFLWIVPISCSLDFFVLAYWKAILSKLTIFFTDA